MKTIKKEDKKVMALDGIDIYQTPQGKYYLVVRWSRERSQNEFDSILDLQNYFKL